jgi:hypothetical protein
MRNFIILPLFIFSVFCASAQTITAQSEFLCYLNRVEMPGFQYEIPKVAKLEGGGLFTLNIKDRDFVLTKWNDSLVKIWETPVEKEKREYINGIYPFGKDAILITDVFNDQGAESRVYKYVGNINRELLFTSKYSLQYLDNELSWISESEDKKQYIFNKHNLLTKRTEKFNLLINPEEYKRISIQFVKNKLLICSREPLSKDTPDDQADYMFYDEKYRIRFFVYDMTDKSLTKINVAFTKPIDYKFLLIDDDFYLIQNIWVSKKSAKINLTKVNVSTNAIVFSKEYPLTDVALLSKHNASRLFTPLPNGNLMYALEYYDVGGSGYSQTMHATGGRYYSGDVNFIIFKPDGNILSDKIIKRQNMTASVQSEFSHGSCIYINSSNIVFLLSKGKVQDIEFTRSDFDGNIIRSGPLFSPENKPKEANYLFTSYTTQLDESTYLFTSIPMTFQSKVKVYKVAIK